MAPAAYTVLPGADGPVDTRMPDTITDWRFILADPGRSQSLTDHVFCRDSWDHFYAQHPKALRIALGAKLADAVVLDLGCGDAFGLENWANECKSYHGVDYSGPALELARRYLPAGSFPHVHFYRGKADADYFSPEFADVAISSEVIEHVDDPKEHIQTLVNFTRPGGFISLSTPCSSIYYYPSEFFPLMRSEVGRTYWRKATRCHEYWQEMLPFHPALPPRVLRSMFADAGLKVLRHTSCTFHVWSRWQLSLQCSRYLERRGWRAHIGVVRALHQFYERLLESRVPYVRFLGTRQFILAQKPDVGGT